MFINDDFVGIKLLRGLFGHKGYSNITLDITFYFVTFLLTEMQTQWLLTVISLLPTRD